jgi:hypothetical protein
MVVVLQNAKTLIFWAVAPVTLLNRRNNRAPRDTAIPQLKRKLKILHSPSLRLWQIHLTLQQHLRSEFNPRPFSAHLMSYHTHVSHCQIGRSRFTQPSTALPHQQRTLYGSVQHHTLPCTTKLSLSPQPASPATPGRFTATDLASPSNHLELPLLQAQSALSACSSCMHLARPFAISSESSIGPCGFN